MYFFLKLAVVLLSLSVAYQLWEVMATGKALHTYGHDQVRLDAHKRARHLVVPLIVVLVCAVLYLETFAVPKQAFHSLLQAHIALIGFFVWTFSVAWFLNGLRAPNVHRKMAPHVLPIWCVAMLFGFVLLYLLP
ncbi:MAG TPA: hypothetical protein VN495_01315 [Candidatus Paceibacterota bacterium]|nr:hypothetical protein [Candidatus Paceibacterota bacterium]